MRLRSLSSLLLCFFIFTDRAFAQSCGSSSSSGQIPSQCFEIVSILVDACGGSTEGENEMVRVKVGNSPLTISSISASWPNNSFRGWASYTSGNTAKINAINSTITACGRLVIPSGGVIPAKANVLIITSENFNNTVHSFAGLDDTLYVLIQTAGNTSGHFANHGTGTRTLTLSYSGGCSDVATYDRGSLVRQNGTNGAEDGATVNFTFGGTPSYVNYGCQVPTELKTIEAGKDSTFCGTSFQTMSTSQGSLCYRWKSSNASAGAFSDTTLLNPLFNINSGFTGTVRLVLHGRSSCGSMILKDSLTLTVTSGSVKPNAGADQNLCAGQAASLNGSSGGTVKWRALNGGLFADSSSASTAFTTPTTTDTGNFAIEYRTISSCGIQRDTLNLHYSRANASFTGPDTVYCRNNSVITLLPAVPGGVFSGHNVSGNTYSPSQAGTDTIKYIIIQGMCKDSVLKKIKVNPGPDASFSGLDTVYCQGMPADTLSPVTAGGIFSGTGMSGKTFVPSSTGNFTVKYVVSQFGCKDSVTKNTRVEPKPSASFGGLDSVYCQGNNPANLIPAETGGTFSGPGVTGNTFIPSAPGNFAVWYTISNSFCKDSLSKTVRVKPSPDASFSGVQTDYCMPVSALLPFALQPGGTFTANGVPFTGSYQPSGPGVYRITYALAAGGCQDSASTNVIVHNKPDASFTGLDTAYCQSQGKISLSPKATGGSFSAPISGHDFSLAVPGTYQVTYIVSNGNCADTFTKTTIVHPSPVAAFTWSPDTISPDKIVQFTFTGNGATNYHWEFNDKAGLTSPAKDPSFTFPDEENYPVLLTVTNQFGCHDTELHVLEVSAGEEYLTIYNAFSPNGDSVNEVFGPVVKGMKQYHFLVYNRWGELLFRTENIYEVWDGNINGHPVPEGVYMFIITARGKSGRVYNREGSVTLIR